ncbi:AAA family ATPase [Micromonospora sp. RHAY321]|uniref:AAA family ATPase n=1 Tax=Micromonospora sp. RHAY321 TaxID=2944807 RepID=UPI00207D4AAB|nr:AAA family ATPase [Micromonospora sp. RHAY321]MCO1595679.1 AAA family ATPase [Micromonospora sp. RHAY321]
MKILELSLPNYKNLRGFAIKFDSRSSTAVLVGKNGVGKSNLIEAIVRIFRDLDAGPGRSRTDFPYAIEYSIRGRTVRITHDPAAVRSHTTVWIDGQKATLRTLTAHPSRSLLPDTVFAYYSGPSNRLESIFDAPLAEFRDAMIRQDASARQRLIYGRLIHSQFVLLSFLAERSIDDFPFLQRELGIEAVESVLFVMKQPYWASRKQGPARKSEFWGAAGVVRNFLSKLYDSALAPLLLEQRTPFGIRQTKTLEHLYLFLSTQEALAGFAERLSSGGSAPRARELFTTLESAFVSDLISDVRVQLRKRNVDGTVTFAELSEGEQQLLMVLGLLRFTKEEESLFLLDEPDTHLNPAWSLRFLDLIEEAVGDRGESQLLMASHDPVAISLLRKEQVRQLAVGEDGRIAAFQPDEDPVRLGVGGVLLSELFGFRSVLAPEMTKLLERRDRLRLNRGRLSEAELLELAELEESLRQVDFSALHPDPLYARFLREVMSQEDAELAASPVLSREEVLDQKRLTEQVVREIRAEEEAGDLDLP